MSLHPDTPGRATAEITVRLELVGAVPADLQDALDCLAAVMLVQAEDGVYLAGSPDAETFYLRDPATGEDLERDNYLVASIDTMTCEAKIIPPATRTVAKVQSFDTFCTCPEPDLDADDKCAKCGKVWS